MNLSDIDRKIGDFLTLTGNKPTAIYLGLKEWHILCKYAFESGVIIDEKFDRYNVPEYIGIKIYKINIESHLGVGV